MKRKGSTGGESPPAKREHEISQSEGAFHPVDTSTPHSLEKKHTETRIHKPALFASLEALYLVHMSKDVLVDAILYSDSSKNKVTLVGRPKLLRSSKKQMRHVTPYSLMEHAINTALTTQTGKKQLADVSYIMNIAEVIKPLVSNKSGICLLQEEYDKLVEKDKISEILKFVTVSQQKVNKVYYLIYNEKIIEEISSQLQFTEKKAQECKELFNKKFKKYTDYGIKYLQDKISSCNQNDPDTITLVCEGIARIILTMFSQDEYAALPTEGNSLLRAIRLYKDRSSAENASGKDIQGQIKEGRFEEKSNTDIVTIIEEAKQKNNIDGCNLRIRIVDNEGATVIALTNMLRMLDNLVGDKIATHINNKKFTDYGTKSCCIKIHGKSLIDKCDQEINADNLSSLFCYHAAKYLYIMFDLKPLEKKVFAAIQGNEDKKDIVTVYSRATGKQTAQYSIQDGERYRELEINRAKGSYNDEVTFLSEMTSEKLKELLIEKVVTHVCYALIPYTQLCMGCTKNDKQDGRQKIFDSFIELVIQDYNNGWNEANVSTKLDEVWIGNVTTQYQKVCNESSLNKSDVSSEPSQISYHF